jgi:hypothetical protein
MQQAPSPVAATTAVHVHWQTWGSDVVCSLSELDDEHPRYNAAIWAIPARPLWFSAPREQAKAFAKQLGAAQLTAAASTPAPAAAAAAIQL